MHGQVTAHGGSTGEVVEFDREPVVDRAVGDLKDRDAPRRSRRERALRSALEKRAAGVPTYTVPEAAALLSVSQEHLYRMIHAGAFPAKPMRAGLEGGRYVVAAADFEEFLRRKDHNGETQETEYAAGGGTW